MMEISSKKPKMSVIISESGDSSIIGRPSCESDPWQKHSDVVVDDEMKFEPNDSLLTHPMPTTSNYSKPNPNKSLQHSKSVINSFVTWLGVSDDVYEKKVVEKWKEHIRRRRCNNRLVGQYRDDLYCDEVFGGSSVHVTPNVVHFNRSNNACNIVDPLSKNIRPTANRQISKISTTSSSRRAMRQYNPIRVGAKESVFKMAFNGIKQAVTPSVKLDTTYSLHRRSISMQQIKQDIPHAETSTMNTTSDDVILDDVFFNEPTPTSSILAPSIYNPKKQSNIHPLSLHHIENHNIRQQLLVEQKLEQQQQQQLQQQLKHDKHPNEDGVDNSGDGDGSDHLLHNHHHHHPFIQLQQRPTTAAMTPTTTTARTVRNQNSVTIATASVVTPSPFNPMQRINDRIMEQSRKSLLDRRNLRKVAMANFLAEAEYRKSRLDSSVRRQLDEMEDHRPYFTCWVTFVQVVCYLFAVSAYDVAPFGLSFSTITEEVLMPNLALEESSYEEENNMWFGLRQADLIHMGAKYSPCMRSDDVIESYVESDRRRERESGCCVRIDGSGCYQTDEDSCSFPFGRDSGKSNTLVWKTWKNNAGPYNRSSGPVCQQDPRYCAKPATPLHQHSWPDDITDWPVCEVPYGSNDLPPHDHDLDHMTCDVTGRPCCVGVKGQCVITTREDCTFKRGYYHDGLTLCSQVNCLEEICGMVPFLYEGRPDQIYRLFFSLFVHAGVVHLLVTVVFQLTIMRDLEKLAGTIRIATIYIVSGLGGCLASVIFLPHLVEAGPSGSQFGLLSCLFVEVIQNRMILKQPYLAILKLSGLMLFLFLLGLMPMIDNFAHLFGFLFGFLLSFVLLPYISISVVDKRNKLMLMIGCFVVCVCLVVILLVVFYLGPIYSCSFCHFINCVPITDTFCRNMKLIKTV